jgi:hypothetical protein
MVLRGLLESPEAGAFEPKVGLDLSRDFSAEPMERGRLNQQLDAIHQLKIGPEVGIEETPKCALTTSGAYGSPEEPPSLA